MRFNTSMIRMAFLTSALLFVAGCSEASTLGNSSPSAGPETSSPPAAQPAQVGEVAPFEIQGDIVKVNNRICAVSRSPMGDETLGQHVSRVQYDGPDPRFAGKTLEFNQCCPMCLESFPQIWAERSDEVMRFHGLTSDIG